jgi:hypothetical protein
MNDFFAPAIPANQLPLEALRIHAVRGDGMFPLLRGNWDYVLVSPLHTYRGEGIYLLDYGVGEDLFRVSPAWDGKKSLSLSRENRVYQDHTISVGRFEECVLGIVVADIKVRDERMLREAVEGGR